MPQINSPTPDATTTSKGKIQLAGDLAGTATAPTLSTTAIKLGYAEITSNFTLASTTSNVFADVTGLSSTVTVPTGGRDVYVTFKGTVRSAAGSGQGVAVAVAEGSTILDSLNWDLATSSFGVNATFTARISAPSAGSHTYKIQIGHTATAALAVLAGTPTTPSTSGKAYILTEIR